jgi:hypothetical protein
MANATSNPATLSPRDLATIRWLSIALADDADTFAGPSSRPGDLRQLAISARHAAQILAALADRLSRPGGAV